LLDSVVMANEVIEEVRNNMKYCLIAKLDFEKAYDLVRQDFLYYMLGRLSFGIKLLSWIKIYLESWNLMAAQLRNSFQQDDKSKGTSSPFFISNNCGMVVGHS